MTGLVDRYSSLARAIGPDGQPARKTEIEPLLQDVVDGFAILYRRTPLEIDHSCEAGLLVPIPKHDLEAMLSNLVSNAHKFADARVRVSAQMVAEGLRLTVEDDGPGISETLRSAAFNWGKRLDEAPPGTGFGLSIVRDIADLYDGSVALAQSADLGGLRVDIDLPVAPDLAELSIVHRWPGTTPHPIPPPQGGCGANRRATERRKSLHSPLRGRRGGASAKADQK